MRLETVEEACETRLVYLGDNLFGKLLQKPVQLNSEPIDLDEIHKTRILHREHNLMEMFIEHAEATDMNAQNVNVVRNVPDYISPMDTTTILSTKRTIFDEDYLPEMKVEDPDIRNTNYVLNETIGSSMGEIVFPAPTVKIETMDFDDQDIANTILTEHSPQCQLHLRISNIISIRSNSHNSTNESQSRTNQTIGKIISEQSSSGAPSSQGVTHTTEDVKGILSPSSRTSEKSMDATPSFTNIDNIPKVKSTSQEVSQDNLAVPIVFNDSQEVTIPYTNSDYTVGNSLQDITIGSQDITNVSQDITNVLNLATASSNSDTNMPMIDNTLDTEAKSTSQVVTASPLKDITIPT